jgi:hypothetical protein
MKAGHLAFLWPHLHIMRTTQEEAAMAAIACNALHAFRDLLDAFVTNRMQHAAAEAEYARARPVMNSQPQTTNPQ